MSNMYCVSVKVERCLLTSYVSFVLFCEGVQTVCGLEINVWFYYARTKFSGSLQSF